MMGLTLSMLVRWSQGNYNYSVSHEICTRFWCALFCCAYIIRSNYWYSAGCFTATGAIIGLWYTWWRHQMETFSTLLAICVGNSPITGEFPTQRPVTRSFDIFFDLRLNKRLSKQSWGWWFETLLRPLLRHSNQTMYKMWTKPCTSSFGCSTHKLILYQKHISNSVKMSFYFSFSVSLLYTNISPKYKMILLATRLQDISKG